MDVEFWWKVRWFGWGLVILSIAIALLGLVPRGSVALINGIGVFLVAFGHYKEKKHERK